MVSNFFFCLIPAVLALIGVRKLRERSWGFCRNKVLLNNKVAVVTGANSGIGYEVAKELASRNATVVLACRNMHLAKQAIEKMERQLNKSLTLTAMELDLASLKSVKQFAGKVQDLFPHIHLLVNNAGVAYPKNTTLQTEDKYEIHFGVNHLGHFYLTNLLLDTLKKSAPSRVVIVSSALHEKGKIDFNNLENGVGKPGVSLYSNSKLANIYFCRELSKRTAGSGVNIYALCPGWVYTSLFRHSVRWFHYILVAPIAFFFMRSAKQGAQTVLFCATEPSLESQSGLLYRNCSLYTSKVEFSEEVASKLWAKSQSLIDKVVE